MSIFCSIFRQAETHEDDDVDMVNLGLTLQTRLESDACLEGSEARLPKYDRCAARTLNHGGHSRRRLCSRRRTIQTRLHERHRKMQSVVEQVASLQHLLNIVKSHLGRFLLVPYSTRWNCIYRELEQIRGLGSGINTLLDDLNLPRIAVEDLAFV